MSHATLCVRCGLRESVHSVDVDFCADCWTVDETDEIMRDHALDVAMGDSCPDGALDFLRVAFGRAMTGEESERWAENLAEARRQVAR